MSTKTPYRVMHMTRLRLGKSIDQVREMLIRFNPAIHSHIEIKVQASDEITYLEQQLAKQAEQNEELKAILRDFLTTKEDHRTWRDEMFSTIKDILGED